MTAAAIAWWCASSPPRVRHRGELVRPACRRRCLQRQADHGLTIAGGRRRPGARQSAALLLAAARPETLHERAAVGRAFPYSSVSGAGLAAYLLASSIWRFSESRRPGRSGRAAGRRALWAKPGISSAVGTSGGAASALVSAPVPRTGQVAWLAGGCHRSRARPRAAAPCQARTSRSLGVPLRPSGNRCSLRRHDTTPSDRAAAGFGSPRAVPLQAAGLTVRRSRPNAIAWGLLLARARRRRIISKRQASSLAS